MKETRRHRVTGHDIFNFIIPCLFLVATNGAGAADAPSDAAVREAVVARMKTLRSLIVIYDVEEHRFRSVRLLARSI